MQAGISDEYVDTQLCVIAAAVALAILLLLALKSNQTKHAGSQLRYYSIFMQD